jgi:hypothetical protein
MIQSVSLVFVFFALIKLRFLNDLCVHPIFNLVHLFLIFQWVVQSQPRKRLLCIFFEIFIVFLLRLPLSSL